MSKTLYIMSSCTLRRRQNTLLIETANEKPRYVPIETTREIVVMGDAELNKSMLELLNQHKIILHFFNYTGRYSGTYYPSEHTNSGPVLLAQAMHCADADKRLAMAVAFVTGGIANMRRVASYYQWHRNDVDAKDIIAELEYFHGLAEQAQNIPELMGIEGSARIRYYQLFDRVISNSDFKMVKRMRRPSGNIMNALISFLNAMSYSLALSQIYQTHLDPRISYLHEPSGRRLSLNLDLAEIFKPLLADRLIFSLVNRRMINACDFDKDSNGDIRLKKDKCRMILQKWDERLDETIENDGRMISWRGLVLKEARKIEKHIMGEAVYKPFIWQP